MAPSFEVLVRRRGGGLDWGDAAFGASGFGELQQRQATRTGGGLPWRRVRGPPRPPPMVPMVSLWTPEAGDL